MKMEKIASFTIDHIKLQPGVYVSRKDKVGENTITTFYLRMTSPNEEPVMNTAEMHHCSTVCLVQRHRQLTSLAGTLYKTCDIYDFASSWDDASWVNNLCQLVESLIWYGDDAQVWFDSTEREVSCLCLCTRQTVEQCRLTHVWEAYNTTF